MIQQWLAVVPQSFRVILSELLAFLISLPNASSRKTIKLEFNLSLPDPPTVGRYLVDSKRLLRLRLFINLSFCFRLLCDPRNEWVSPKFRNQLNSLYPIVAKVNSSQQLRTLGKRIMQLNKRFIHVGGLQLRRAKAEDWREAMCVLCWIDRSK